MDELDAVIFVCANWVLPVVAADKIIDEVFICVFAGCRWMKSMIYWQVLLQ